MSLAAIEREMQTLLDKAEKEEDYPEIDKKHIKLISHIIKNSHLDNLKDCISSDMTYDVVADMKERIDKTQVELSKIFEDIEIENFYRGGQKFNFKRLRERLIFTTFFLRIILLI